MLTTRHHHHHHRSHQNNDDLKRPQPRQASHAHIMPHLTRRGSSPVDTTHTEATLGHSRRHMRRSRWTRSIRCIGTGTGTSTAPCPWQTHHAPSSPAWATVASHQGLHTHAATIHRNTSSVTTVDTRYRTGQRATGHQFLTQRENSAGGSERRRESPPKAGQQRGSTCTSGLRRASTYSTRRLDTGNSLGSFPVSTETTSRR